MRNRGLRAHLDSHRLFINLVSRYGVNISTQLTYYNMMQLPITHASGSLCQYTGQGENAKRAVRKVLTKWQHKKFISISPRTVPVLVRQSLTSVDIVKINETGRVHFHLRNSDRRWR